MTKYKIINGVGIIPNGTTEIEDYAFSRKKSFAINLLSSLSTFFSFSRKSQLKKIAIPNSVTKIGIGAFADCKSLTSITIPNSVTEIGDEAFSGCEALTSITIPNSVTEIGNSAFEGCKALTSITIPNSVTEIGAWAFSDCKALTSVTIPNSVTEIGFSAFEGCEALTSVTIPNSVTKIGFSAFEGCKNLEELILFHTDPAQIRVPEEDGLEDGLGAEQATLYVPKESVADFQEDSFWSEFAAIKPITDDMLK